MSALGSLLRSWRTGLARRDNRRGIEHWKRGELTAAQSALRKATRRNPRYAGALSNLGMVLIQSRRQDEGLALLERAIEVDPRHAGALNNLGAAMILGNNPSAAVKYLEAALQAEPKLAEAHANLLGPMMEICGWAGVERRLNEWLALTENTPPEVWAERVRPFDLMALPVPRELQRAVGRYHASKLVREFGGTLAAAAPPAPAPRLRIGYVSSDIRNHATTHLCVGLFGRHERSRFEVTVYSFSKDDGSVYRKRVEAECEHFVDITALSLDETQRRIASDGIHVLVDMKGYCGGGRPEIFARRAAPVQVSYLGYPNSMHAPFMDYLVADRVVVPEADLEWYSEAAAWLPGTYQINDREQAIDERTPSRAEQGLPERGFVFCCFNSSYKIEPQIFASWMRILKEVPGSVLWLYRSNVPAKLALREAAEGHGVDHRRLVFAMPASKPQHLARLRLADLMLDTHFYDGHTTTTDALWAGVPVLTQPGEMFASRVAASLLTAVGLPELIVPTREEYERRAVELAREPQALGALRARLDANRLSMPLFDTDAHVRHLEGAFETMWAAHARGERPQPFEAGT